MRQSTCSPAAVLFLLGALAIATTMVACGGSATPTPLTPATPSITALPSLDEMLSEKIIGGNSSASTIIEYVSFWSPDSATFYLTGEGAKMKSQLADTGLAQIYFRNLIVMTSTGGEVDSNGRPEAAMLARCVGNARFFDAVTTLFQRQSSWTAGGTANFTVLQSVMLGFGMSQALENACLSNSGLFNGLATIHNNAEAGSYQLPDGTTRAGVSGGAGAILNVPAVVVNGVLFDGTNTDGTANSAFAPTLANIQPFLK